MNPPLINARYIKPNVGKSFLHTNKPTKYESGAIVSVEFTLTIKWWSETLNTQADEEENRSERGKRFVNMSYLVYLVIVGMALAQEVSKNQTYETRKSFLLSINKFTNLLF